MSKENLKIWDNVEKVPEGYLKKIKGGRLKGMTDINPMWRLKALTEIYGPCGTGWIFTIDRTEVHELHGEAVYVVFGHLQVCVDGKWAEGIQGVGASKIAAKESSGIFVNDEAPKMAETDAISVACKKLGFGSLIYEGKFDGSKYNVSDSSGATERPSGGSNSPGTGKESGEGDKLSLNKRRELLSAFKKIEVSVQTVEELIGKPQTEWLVSDVGILQGHWKDENKKFKAKE